MTLISDSYKYHKYSANNLFTNEYQFEFIYLVKFVYFKMGFLTVLKKIRQKEKEMRILLLYPF